MNNTYYITPYHGLISQDSDHVWGFAIDQEVERRTLNFNSIAFSSLILILFLSIGSILLSNHVGILLLISINLTINGAMAALGVFFVLNFWTRQVKIDLSTNSLSTRKIFNFFSVSIVYFCNLFINNSFLFAITNNDLSLFVAALSFILVTFFLYCLFSAFLRIRNNSRQ